MTGVLDGGVDLWWTVMQWRWFECEGWDVDLWWMPNGGDELDAGWWWHECGRRWCQCEGCAVAGVLDGIGNERKERGNQVEGN